MNTDLKIRAVEAMAVAGETAETRHNWSTLADKMIRIFKEGSTEQLTRYQKDLIRQACRELDNYHYQMGNTRLSDTYSLLARY